MPYKAIVFLLFLLLIPTTVYAAITGESWTPKLSTYLQPAYPAGMGVLLYGSSKYLNFGSTYGSAGYGVRDNSGTLQVKNSGGSWVDITGGTGTVTSVGLTVPTGLTVSGSPITTTGTLAVSLDTGYVIPLQSTLDTFLTSVVVDSPLTGAGTSASHLSIPVASASANGYLSSTDWITFNNKWDLASTTITVASGGTGATTLTDGGILLGSGTGAITPMAVLGDGSIVIGDGATDPTTLSAFTSSTGTLKHEYGGVEADISAITTGGLLRGASAGAIEVLALGTAGQILGSTGGQLAYLATSTIPVAGDVTGTLGNIAVTDDSHAHTGATLSSIDVSADTNLAVTSPISLTDDTVGFLYNTTNTWTGLNTFTNASNTAVSLAVLDNFYIGRTSTTTINPTATSTFQYGIQTPYLNITGTAATSTFSNGISLSGGCFYVNGSCLSSGGSGTVNSGTINQTAFYASTGTAVSGTSTLTLINEKAGVATSTPQYPLTVYSATNPQLALSAGNNLAQWTFRNAGGNLYVATTTTDGTATTTPSALTILSTGLFGIASSTPNAFLSIQGNGISPFVSIIDPTAVDDIQEPYRLYITPSGNTGISATNISDIDALLTISANSSAGVRNKLFKVGIAAQEGFVVNHYSNGCGGSECLFRYIFDYGELGVGTTTPWGKLSVTNTLNYPSFVVEDSASPDTSPFIIDASGNVGVATTSPSALLAVKGSGTTTGRLFVVSDNNSVEKITVLDNGNTTFVGTLTVTGLTTLGNASTTQQSISGGLYIPSGASQSPTVAGQIAHDTTSNQFKLGLGGSTAVLGNGFYYPAFSYATSTSWTATTTIPLGPAYVAETWSGVQCFTDTGTLNVVFSDGTNKMDLLNASTTVGVFNLSTNNTFTASEKRYVDVGTPASSPTKVSCTLKKALTAD